MDEATKALLGRALFLDADDAYKAAALSGHTETREGRVYATARSVEKRGSVIVYGQEGPCERLMARLGLRMRRW